MVILRAWRVFHRVGERQKPFRLALFDAVTNQLLSDLRADRLRSRHVGISARTVALLQLR